MACRDQSCQMLTKDVLLVGLGAVGTIYAYILQSSKLARVTVVARSNYDVVNAKGMHIRSKKYGTHESWKPYRLVSSVAEAADRSYSYVVITTKAIPEVVETPRVLEPLLSRPYSEMHPQPTYVMLQNGLGVERDLYHSAKALNQGQPKIISALVWIAANLVEKNMVNHNRFDRLTIGMYRHGDHLTTTNSPEEYAILADFGTMLEAGGSEAIIVTEIQRKKFAKTMWNIAFSSFSTLTGSSPAAMFRPPPEEGQSYSPYVASQTATVVERNTIPVLRAILQEMITLGRALGYADNEDGLPSSLVDSTILQTAEIHRDPAHITLPSMLLDAQNGLPIEVEVIVGEVVRMAKEMGVDVPRIDTLYALLAVVQNQTLGGFRQCKL
ncbi:ketopantoate reductase PanE/ApbA-domain-containing protein [Suillus paluster]|uniref:ketopantoate reductase PanE/ApbA-domain-containing protein n=1 Tax=Suillus paluster TaxID=48578 RepID=UPI001B86B49D|nr:ketopantoate reductase PanE/ApbA-domain-containing protein [Suillus paluster]KAG1721235.1 ketopantoate reductase PanE/ApbA-domain-containing protein [Suillus paluster]